MFENPRRGRQARNFTTNVPKILDLKSSSEQIFSRKLSLGAPVIYQEYNDREATSLNYLASNRLHVEVINACLPQEEEESEDDQEDKIRDMAWKRFRPPALQTACESMFIGAMISLLFASFIATIYLSLSYVSFETLSISCTNSSLSVRIQWVRTIFQQISQCLLLLLVIF